MEAESFFSPPLQDELCSIVRAAFAGVRLGSGVGLYEGQALDDYENETTCAEYRAKDESADWTRLSDDALNECYSSLSFFDAEGMRFHLPAFLILEIRGLFVNDLIYTLTKDYYFPQYALLSLAQREAVRVFLKAAAEYETRFCHLDLHRSDIARALDGFWLD